MALTCHAERSLPATRTDVTKKSDKRHVASGKTGEEAQGVFVLLEQPNGEQLSSKGQV